MATQYDPGAKSPRTTRTQLQFFPSRAIGEDGMRLDVAGVLQTTDDNGVVLASVPVPPNTAIHISGVHFVCADGTDCDAMERFEYVAQRIGNAAPSDNTLSAKPVKTEGLFTVNQPDVNIVGNAVEIVVGQGGTEVDINIQARFVVGAVALPEV